MLCDEQIGVCARLGVSIEKALPYGSQARGLIENIHKTVFVRAAKELPTYMGKDMDPQAKKIAYKETRKAVEEGRKSKLLMEWRDCIDFLAQRIEDYNNRPHRGLPKFRDPVTGNNRHLSPNEMLANHIADDWRPLMPEDEDDLFHPQAKRVVQSGEVQLFNNLYFNLELEEWHGQEMLVGYDVHDPGKVWVRDEHQRHICVAELDGNKSDYFPQSVTDQARKRREQSRTRRLERKLEEVQLEGRGREPKTVELTPEQDAVALRIVEESEQRRLAEQRAEAEKMVPIEEALVQPEPLPRNAWEKYELLLTRKRRREVLSAEERGFMDEFEIKHHLRPEEPVALPHT
jgi:putative transposase